MHLTSALPVIVLLAVSLVDATPFSTRPVLNTRGTACSIPYTRVNNTNAIMFEQLVPVFDHAIAMTRFKFRVNDDSLINSMGRDVLNRLRCHDGGGVYNNWQFWNSVGTVWFMEFNELNLAAGGNAVNKAIFDVTGKANAIPQSWGP